MTLLPTPGQSAVMLGKRPRAFLLAILTSGVVACLSPGQALALGPKALTVTPGASVRVSIGKSRLTSLASATLTVPAGDAVDFGFQFRVRASSSYVAKLSARPDGTTLSGSFTRLKGAAETTLGSPLDLGVTAAAGDKIHLEATVVAKRVVKLYLRAWKDGTEKPAT